MAKKYLIETFGCQMNVHDSERMAGLLDSAGYEATTEDVDADVIVINTCSVREHAEEKLYTRLGQLRVLQEETGRNPVVAVTGCVAQQEGAALLRNTNGNVVDLVLGTQRLKMLPLLVEAGYRVLGTTRKPERVAALGAAGAEPILLDVFDAAAVHAAFARIRPEILIHQLTDLPQRYDPATFAAASARNARLRIEGTRNLVAAAEQSGIRRFIVQSIAFAYAPGPLPHREDDPLDPSPVRATTVDAVRIMEQAAARLMRRDPCRDVR